MLIKCRNQTESLVLKIMLSRSKSTSRFPLEDTGNRQNMKVVFRSGIFGRIAANFLCFPAGTNRKLLGNNQRKKILFTRFCLKKSKNNNVILNL